MRISCDVDVVNRSLPGHGFRGKGRSVRTSLAIGKKPCAGSAGSLFLMLCTANDRKGSKYKLKENIHALFTKFINEGKATIRIKEPAQDLCLSKADPLQLKNFLTALKLGHQNKDLKPTHLTTLTPATVKQVEKPKTKLCIHDRKDYPITTSFPKSLEVLEVSNCRLRRFDSRMLTLRHLRRLDLSDNAIEDLPESWDRICRLSELSLSNNKLRFISKSFVQSCLSETLHSLDLSENCLEVLPRQLFDQFKRLVRVNLAGNQLSSMPYSAGLLASLKYLNLARNNLNSVPSSFATLRLDEIDLHGNPFSEEGTTDPQETPSLHFPTLLEFSGQAVVKYRLRYCPQTVPSTVCMFLDGAMYCYCSRPCFRPYSQPMEPLNIHSIAGSVMMSNGSGTVVSMRGVLCSRNCSQLRKRGGGAWRAWCRRGAKVVR